MSEQNAAPERPEGSERASDAEQDGEESFGSWLRSQREARGVDLEAIAQSTKINIHYLELLEEDRFDLLPAPIFARGFLREYARVVGLDPDDVLNCYVSVHGDDADRRFVKRGGGRSGSTRRIGRTVAGLGGLVLVSGAVVWFVSLDRGAGRDVEAIAPPVTEAPPLPPTPGPAPEQALQVTVDFRGTSWVDVFVDDERTVSELRVQGESLTVTADREVRITLGRVEAATIEVNGEPYAHGADDGQEIVIAAPEQESAE